MKSFIRFAFVALMLVSPLALTACNTMEGAGRDIERGGEKMQNAADRNR
ncbi:MAG TPA: entericidin A/B family lipoprotein [Tepidisphaeraceae bacterium]|nr:entericidin A/B family lipoprotein [Tepidisphaeraceae bacterium]